MKENDSNNTTNRVIYFDCLRTIAAFCVVMTHVAQQIWYKYPIGTYEWGVANIYESAVRWSVPVFVMISGALFLSSGKSFRLIIKNNLYKMTKLLAVWGGVFFVEGIALGKGINSSIFSIIYGPLWFLFMLIGLYALIPFFRKFTSDDRLVIYFLALGILSTFIIPTLSRSIGIFSDSAKRSLDIVIENFHFHFASGYASYFVLGYWINKSVIAKRHKRIIGILGLASFVVLPVITGYKSAQTGSVYDYYGNLTLGILFESIFVFCLAKDIFISFSSRFTKVCRIISKYTLGIYLIHGIMIDVFNEIIHIRWDFVNTAFSLPFLCLCIFIISGLASMALSKIPIIKKVIF